MQYTEKFLAAIPTILAHEGGYVNDPHDKGGETKFGISKRSYPNVDIKNLTQDQATAIYYTDFWCKGPYESIADAALAKKVFDTAVNVGTSRALKFLQQAANAQGANLVVDGLVGPKTIAAVNAQHAPSLLASYREVQANYYLDIIKRNPTQVKFKNGWLKRANS